VTDITAVRPAYARPSHRRASLLEHGLRQLERGAGRSACWCWRTASAHAHAVAVPDEKKAAI